jgi:acyl transferase domain-containing protein
MAKAAEIFRKVAAKMTFAAPRIPIVSNVTGQLATAGQLMSPDYWARHILAPVRFLDGMRELENLGVTLFTELGPDGTLCGMGAQCLAASAAEALLVPVLRPAEPEPASLLTALAHLSVRGIDVNWARAAHLTGARRVPLPAYPFERGSYWLAPDPAVRGPRVANGPEARFWSALASGDPARVAELLELDETQQAVIAPALPVLSAWHERAHAVPPATATAEEEAAAAEAALTADGTWLSELSGTPRAERERLVLDLVLAHAATVLGHDCATLIDKDSSLPEIGFSSFTALELSNRLKEETGMILPPAAIYDHPTPAALARYLCDDA